MGDVITLPQMIDEADDEFTEELKAVIDSLNSAKMSDETLKKIKDYILIELKIMLGMSPLEEEVIEEITPLFFDDIQDVYDQSNDYCYFCSPLADPNDEAYGEFRRACPICTMKLVSFMESAGITGIKAKFDKAHRRGKIEQIGRC